MPTTREIETWEGRTLHDADGDKIGEITSIYVDAETGAPDWMAVKTGLMGSSVNLVPVSGATPSEDGISVPYRKSFVKDAPSYKADEEISAEQSRELYEHYSMASTGRHGAGGPVGHDTSGPTTDDAMTRSEEELHVGTEARETGRARLRKSVVTEHVEKTVPVQREEVRVEREPITHANVDAATDGPALSEAEHEVTLYAEEPVVEKRVVPKERVRLDKDTHTEDAHVSEEVRSERIETDRDR